jgi:hypothetical protein
MKIVTNCAIISFTRKGLSWSYVRLHNGVEMHSWNDIRNKDCVVVYKYNIFVVYSHLCLQGRSRS